MKLFNYFVYILKCSDKSYYTGITNDIERRLFEHNSGIKIDAYTNNKRPVELLFYEAFVDVNKEITFEKN